MKAAKSTRAPFAARPFLLVNSDVVARIQALLANVPIDTLRPLEVVVREQAKKRGQSANALMWAGPLKDIAEQAWIDGRQFGAETLHEFFKREFLPEEYDAELCLDGYRKWDIDPLGNRVLIGSTTQLTPKGMSMHLEQVFEFGARLGVTFTAQPVGNL